MNTEYNFPVSLRNIFDERGQAIPHYKGVTRGDTHKTLSIVSDRYNLIKHEKMVDAFAPFARDLGPHETCFTQERDGARLVMSQLFREVTMTLPGHKIPGQPRAVGDVVALKTYGINSYNTTTPLTMQVGCLVLRCLNGAVAFDSMFGLHVKHVGKDEPEINLPTTESVIAAFHRTGDIWKEYAETPVSQETKEEFISASVKNYRFTNDRAIEKEKGRFEQCETLWDLYNAFTHLITHNTRKIQETSRLNRFDRLNFMFQNLHSKSL